MKLKGKNVLVLGLGVSGFAAARLLLRHGARVEVRDDSRDQSLQERARALEARGATVFLGGPFRNGKRFDLAVLSPGIPVTAPIVREILADGVELISELELGFRACHCPIIAVTGSNGKTTTTELVRSVLEAGGKRVMAAGNIGLALSEAAAHSETLDVMVVEVSSFQLETIDKFRPRVSVMLNITPNHLDRYSSLREYALAKAQIYRNQTDTDFAVINAATVLQMEALGVKIPSQRRTFSAAGLKADLWLENGVIHGSCGYLRGPLLAMNETFLRGPHNAEDAMAALAVGSFFAVPRNAMVEALRAYKPQPHRMELVMEIGGVTFVNDSKATSVDAVEKALITLRGPVVLISGGKDKGSDFTPLRMLLKEKVRAVMLIGEARKKLAKAWGDIVPCYEAATLRDAVWRAAALSKRGDTVLLGPACSSFDMFKNYEDRGNTFKQLVRELSISPEARSAIGAERGLREEKGENPAPIRG